VSKKLEDQMLLLQDKLDNHLKDYEQHKEDEHARWEQLIEAQRDSTDSINQLTKRLTHIITKTEDIIDAWAAVNGTVKTMSVLGKFIKWMAGLGVVGVAIAWVIEKMGH